MIRALVVPAALAFAGLAAAQSTTQATGTVNTAPPVPKAPTLAPAASVSDLGLSERGAANSGGVGNAGAGDSGPQPWKDVMGWLGLKRGMSEAEVTDLLGADHKESITKSGKLWSYQDQKALLFGSVTFKDGQLENWTSPRF